MRLLILSDIHANLEALETVLRHAEGAYGQIACCGDLVGYNGSPREVVDWARGHVDTIVRGNHDLVCCGLASADSFNAVAREASLWTAGQLDDGRRAWLAALPAGPLLLDDYELAHGSPAGEDDYLVDIWDVAGLDLFLRRKICFIGHTHLQGGWYWQRGGLRPLGALEPGEDERVVELHPDSLYIINPGSVGQPRDGDPRAHYALWDVEDRLLSFRRVAYDIGSAQSRILAAGLPASLALRLSLGR